MFDLIVRGGTVVDGTGAPAVRRDVGVRGGKIAALGDLGAAVGTAVIDAAGRAVAPGFVDAHAHSDIALLINPTCESQVLQGITTEIMGNCGYSPFPVHPANTRMLLDPPGTEVSWSGVEEYLDRLSRGTSINAYPLVGHGKVRAAVLGRQDRPATPEEIRLMREHVREAMHCGARGLSTGLDYEPSTASDLEEIVELAEVVAQYGGIYTTHIRGYSHNVLNAVAEAIEVGRRAGTPVVISHLGVFGRQNWGRGPRLIGLMARARAQGVKVACDMMAYPTAGAWWGPRAILPPWAYDWRKPWEMQVPSLRAIIADQDSRARLRGEIEARRTRPKFGFDQEFLMFSDWRDIYLMEVAPGSPAAADAGRTIGEIAASRGVEPVDLFLRLIQEEGEHLSTLHAPLDPEAFDLLMRDPFTMFGTDAIGSAIHRLHEPFNPLQPHPRHFGTFPRLLETFVRREGRLTLEEAIRRMTSLPADVFGLRGRGRLAEGCAADMVVFDPATIAERGTYRRPAAYPAGIDAVIVNGSVAARAGSVTGDLPGRPLVRQ
ncbi:MAG: D-aminoacylase [Armatimonadetes bacterium]|nr:D-aminoacylase [Armatimonadota bacterium]